MSIFLELLVEISFVFFGQELIESLKGKLALRKILNGPSKALESFYEKEAKIGKEDRQLVFNEVKVAINTTKNFYCSYTELIIEASLDPEKLFRIILDNYKINSELSEDIFKKTLKSISVGLIQIATNLPDYERFRDSKLLKNTDAIESLILKHNQLEKMFSDIISEKFPQHQTQTQIIKDQFTKPVLTDKEKYIFRKKLADKINSVLKITTFVQIYGSTGMGKSILSIQVVENDIDNWIRISLKGLEGNKINKILYELRINNSNNFILDDLNFTNDYYSYEDSLLNLIHSLNTNGKKIIITSQKKMSMNFVLKINNCKEDNFFSVPRFDKEEVKEILILYSCPRKDIDFWLMDVELVTKFHPQLVHARVNRLREESWNKENAIFKVDEIKKIKDENIQKLFLNPPSKEGFNFIIRLSILIGNFRKPNALSLSKYPTIINNPGVIFDQLVGPYIEQVSEEYYQLTPLLEGSYKDNFSGKEIVELNRLAGESYLSLKTLTPSELSNTFMYGLQSNSENILQHGILAFNSIKPSEKNLIYPYIDWISLFQKNEGRKIFEQNDIVNFMLRQIQFILAAEKNDEKAANEIAVLWFEELKELLEKINNIPPDNTLTKFPILFYFNVFRFNKIYIPMSNCLIWLFEFMAYANDNSETFNDLKMEFNNQEVSMKQEIIEIALFNRVNLSTVEEFLSIISSHLLGDELLSEINRNNFLSEIIINNIWIQEINNSDPNWDRVINILYKFHELSYDKKAYYLSALSLKAVAVIEMEYLSNKDKALETISKGMKILDDNLELLNYKAKIFFLEKDYEKSLKIWKKIIPNLPQNLSLEFVYRDAFVSAANCNELDLSLDYIKKAMDIAKNNKDIIYEVQCNAEYGYLLWQLENYPESLKIFDQVVESLPKLPSPQQNLRTLGIYKMVSNTLLFLKNCVSREFNKEKIPAKPFYGMFSQLDFDERLKELPIPPFNSLMVFLVEIEYRLGLGSTIFNKTMTLYDEIPVLFQIIIIKIKILKSLKSADLSNIIEYLISYASLLVMDRRITNKYNFIGKPNKEDLSNVIEKLGSEITRNVAFSILCFDLKKVFEEVPKDHWITIAKKNGLERVEEWNKFISYINEINFDNAREVIRDNNASSYLRIIASIYILTHDNDEDLRYDSLIAGSLLTLSIKEGFYFYKEIENNLANIIANRWINITSRLYQIYKDDKMKIVLDICKDKKITGVKKAAKIILAANEISIHKVNNLIDELAKLTEE